jgi:serine/threonine-protein kinase
MGSFSESPQVPVRLEAAYWRSKLVWFRTIGPWREVASRTRELRAGEKIAQVLSICILLASLVGGALLARHNIRLGRGDRRGALRLALILFAVEMLIWALRASHVPTAAEIWLLIMALAKAAYVAGMAWMIYLALEPYVRRRWPQTLISWNRVVFGSFADPLAGTHVLIGAMFGALLALLTQIVLHINQGARISTDLAVPSLSALLGGKFAAAHLLELTDYAIVNSLYFLYVMFVLRLLLRNQAVAAVALVSITSLLFTGTGSGNIGLNTAITGVGGAAAVFLLMRHGLLALVSCVSVVSVLTQFPLTTDLSSWYAGTWLLSVIVVLGAAVFGFRAATAGQAWLTDRALE